MVTTPGFCVQVDICGPSLDLLIDEAAERDGFAGVNVIHAEVYAAPTDEEVGELAPIMAELTTDDEALWYEPVLFVADAGGRIRSASTSPGTGRTSPPRSTPSPAAEPAGRDQAHTPSAVTPRLHMAVDSALTSSTSLGQRRVAQHQAQADRADGVVVQPDEVDDHLRGAVLAGLGALDDDRLAPLVADGGPADGGGAGRGRSRRRRGRRGRRGPRR